MDISVGWRPVQGVPRQGTNHAKYRGQWLHARGVALRRNSAGDWPVQPLKARIKLFSF